MIKRAGFFIILMVFFLVLLFSGCAEKKNYDSFAKCLNDEGVVMYGSDWCPHCAAMKKQFGNSFRFMEYVECNQNIPGSQAEKCREEAINLLPTFKFGDGTKLYGELSFDILSQKTGCELP